MRFSLLFACSHRNVRFRKPSHRLECPTCRRKRTCCFRLHFGHSDAAVRFFKTDVACGSRELVSAYPDSRFNTYPAEGWKLDYTTNTTEELNAKAARAVHVSCLNSDQERLDYVPLGSSELTSGFVAFCSLFDFSSIANWLNSCSDPTPLI